MSFDGNKKNATVLAEQTSVLVEVEPVGTTTIVQSNENDGAMAVVDEGECYDFPSTVAESYEGVNTSEVDDNAELLDSTRNVVELNETVNLDADDDDDVQFVGLNRNVIESNESLGTSDGDDDVQIIVGKSNVVESDKVVSANAVDEEVEADSSTNTLSAGQRRLQADLEAIALSNLEAIEVKNPPREVLRAEATMSSSVLSTLSKRSFVELNICGKQRRFCPFHYSSVNAQQPSLNQKKFCVVDYDYLKKPEYDLYRYECLGIGGVMIGSHKRVFVSTTRLRTHIEEACDRYLLLQVMHTFCANFLYGFLVYDKAMGRASVWSVDEICRFWCDTKTVLSNEDLEEFENYRVDYLNHHSMFYDRSKGVAKDIKNVEGRRETTTPKGLVNAEEMWKLIPGRPDTTSAAPPVRTASLPPAKPPATDKEIMESNFPKKRQTASKQAPTQNKKRGRPPSVQAPAKTNDRIVTDPKPNRKRKPTIAPITQPSAQPVTYIQPVNASMQPVSIPQIPNQPLDPGSQFMSFFQQHQRMIQMEHEAAMLAQTRTQEIREVSFDYNAALERKRRKNELEEAMFSVEKEQILNKKQLFYNSSN